MVLESLSVIEYNVYIGLVMSQWNGSSGLFLLCEDYLLYGVVVKTTLPGSGKVSESLVLCSRKLKNIIQ